MKALLSLFVCISLTASGFAALSAQKTIRDIPDAADALRRTVSAKFYQSLIISPVAGWVIVRGQLAGNHLIANKVVRSDYAGQYDSLALELANNLQVLTNTGGFESATTRHVLVHVLLYEIADGRLAISFANFDGPGGNQNRAYGAAWMAVHKGDDRWVTIEPGWHPSAEHRGPRSYMLAVHGPGIDWKYRGVGYRSTTVK